MSDEAALREELAAVTRELRRLRAGELVAKLTEAERDAIAIRVADRLEERLFPRGRQRAGQEQPPARQKPAKKRFYRS